MYLVILSISMLFGYGFYFGIQGNEIIICSLLFVVIISLLNVLLLRSELVSDWVNDNHSINRSLYQKDFLFLKNKRRFK
jgi:hypothetical protein